jgi:hypothetical protein
MKDFGMRCLLKAMGLLSMALASCLLVIGTPAPPAFAAPPAPRQQSFATAEAGIDALVGALRNNDIKALLSIFGPAGQKLVVSGDAVADSTARKLFIDDYLIAHTLTPSGSGRMVLSIGPTAWPLPIPLVQVAGRWRFDTASGAQEILDRRIGRNELRTLRTLLAGVEAERDYFDRLKRGAGAGAYTARLLSTPGTQDGLYWPVATGAPMSPLGPLIAQAEDEGYPGSTATGGKPLPYQGYFYKALKQQGNAAPGGAKRYERDGTLVDGFAFLAWPATYRGSGIMSFVVNQDGVVFQKDLGATTSEIVARITAFDPDASWARIDIAD